MAYPSGVGTNYLDPRKTNYSKTQTLSYSHGVHAVRDFAETTTNPAPRPTDLLGTNLRKGKGLSFSQGVSNFGGYVQGAGFRTSSSNALQATAAKENRPLSAQYENGRLLSGFHRESKMLQSQRANDESLGTDRSGRSGRSDRHEYSRDEVNPNSRPGSRLRPQSAPLTRSYQQSALPNWAQDQPPIPSFDKSVDNAKPRPGSAKYRPSSGLPLSFIPQWISQDKKMLSYEAYFRETVEESALEKCRVRRCVIQYFLEDDTIKVLEPREENSGIPQGPFLKRHKVPKGAEGIVTWRDISVPGEISLYGRTFKVTKCDEITAQFYASHGISVDSSPEGVPVDPLHRTILRSRPSSSKVQNSYCLLTSSIARANELPAGKVGNSIVPVNGESVFHGKQLNDLKGYMEAQLGRCQDRKENVTKYLSNDRKVLRFYCTWDEKTPDGVVDKRPFVLHFFLADDTVEVLEVNMPNSGRDPFPALLKRTKLPIAYNGTTASITGTGGGTERFYTARDLQLGGVVSVFGRQLVLNSCDDSTARYYRDVVGVDMTPPAPPPRPPRPQSAVIVPPHNGFGKEEDSRQNCLSLHPKPPRQNVIRLLENKGKLLRFVAKIENATGFDVERVFVVSYYLDSDELAIFEPPVKNSGRSGGKFAERCKVRKPGSADYYAEADMYLGARIVVNTRVFVLVDADEFTLQYMEAHPEVYPYSDVATIARRVQASAGSVDRELRRFDPSGSGEVPPEDFKSVLLGSVPGLQEQEVHTLARSLARGERVQYEPLLSGSPGSMSPGLGDRHGASGGYFRAASRRGGGSEAGDAGALGRLREQLYRRGPSGLRGLERALRHVSRGAGAVDRADLDTVLGFCGVSLPEDAVGEIFTSLDGGDGLVRSADLCAAIRPQLSSAAATGVRQVFESLEDPTFRTGAVEVEEVLERYRAGRHPRVFGGEMTEAEARRELSEALEGLTAVVEADLAAHYADVVAGYRLSDAELLELLRLTWGLGSRH